MKLLLLSNSTNVGEPYLGYALGEISAFLGREPLKVLFIPYAAVTFSFDEYEEKVKSRINQAGHEVISIHRFSSPAEAVKEAEAIMIGGGNTFHLLKGLQENDLIEPIRNRVIGGIPYIGWSAGSNVACPAITTTNDMPVVEVKNFKALNLIPFQINPHYYNQVIPGFGGETRDQRLAEFLKVNTGVTVAGLREGTMLRIEDGSLRLIGPHTMRIMHEGTEPREYEASSNLNFLLE